jgi:hypothetical protein
MSRRPKLGLLAPMDGGRQVPRPPKALNHVMDAMQGNGTPWCYLSASVFTREMAEFGALWHGCEWSTHQVIDGDPRKDAIADGVLSGSSRNVDEWRWMESEPLEWRPRVTITDTNVTVEFYTYCRYLQEGIFRNTDIYAPGQYRFRSESKGIAEGPRGYLF